MEGRVRREGIVFDTSVTLSNMAKTYLQLNDSEMTFYMYEEALLLQTSRFKKDHILSSKRLNLLLLRR